MFDRYDFSRFNNESSVKDYLKILIERKELGIQMDDFNERLKVTTEYCMLVIQNINKFFTEIFDSVGIKVWKVPS